MRRGDTHLKDIVKACLGFVSALRGYTQRPRLPHAGPSKAGGGATMDNGQRYRKVRHEPLATSVAKLMEISVCPYAVPTGCAELQLCIFRSHAKPRHDGYLPGACCVDDHF